jgi:hypothetical protein
MNMNRRTILAAAAIGSVALSATLASAAPERHPEIRKAIGALQRAKNDLEHADHDFGGHRKEALEAVNRAIEQLRMALQFDK